MVERFGVRLASSASELTGTGVIAADIETSGVHPIRDRVALITLYDPGAGAVLVTRNINEAVELLHRRESVWFNGFAFDLVFLAAHHGLNLKRVKAFDCIVAEQVLATGARRVSHTLKDTLRRRLNVEIAKNVDHGSWMQSAELSEEQLQYVIEDVVYLPKLMEHQLTLAREAGVTEALELETKLGPLIASMIRRGVPIDISRLEAYVDEYGSRELVKLTNELEAKFPGLNPRSPKQLIAAYEKLGYRTASTESEHLNDKLGEMPEEAAEFTKLVLAYRKAAKVLMYGEEWVAEHIVNGRIHPRWRQLGTDTGRMSCTDPNLQQIPRGMRSVFGGSGVFEKFDYSQIEVRVAAALYRDDEMLSALASGEDIHSEIATKIFGEVTPEKRKMAKALTFALLYGGSANTLRRHARSYGANIEDPNGLMRVFFSRFRGFARSRVNAQELARAGGARGVRLPLGYRRVLSGDKLTSTRLLNTRVQGTAAIGAKLAMVRLWEAGLADTLVAQVHDELVFNPAEPFSDEVRREVERVMIESMLAVCEKSNPRVEHEFGEYWS